MRRSGGRIPLLSGPNAKRDDEACAILLCEVTQPPCFLFRFGMLRQSPQWHWSSLHPARRLRSKGGAAIRCGYGILLMAREPAHNLGDLQTGSKINSWLDVFRWVRENRDAACPRHLYERLVSIDQKCASPVSTVSSPAEKLFLEETS